MNWMVENARWVAPLSTFLSVYLAVLALWWPQKGNPHWTEYLAEKERSKAWEERPSQRHGLPLG